ncbi:MAG: AAA family ATPase [Endomicrobium sp.]|jgi:hypothetical protein|nr:AAA family ATPase [Endomicrobium sp.]
MKKLPTSAQSFEVLRQAEYVYVDKTKYIYELINSGRVYFLSRPRRFGKSLLISAFEELFNANKKLFEGLYIYDKWNWDEKNPVLHLDFTDLAYNTPEELKSTLSNFLDKSAEGNEISLRNDMPVSVKVYNPFSTLLLFEKREFANRWFRTGTPTFLMELIHKHNRPQAFLETIILPSSSFESYDPDNLNEIPLLFQTGYLTVTNKISSIDGVEYTLDFPDREVKDSFLQYLLSFYTAYPSESMPEMFKNISEQLKILDAQGLQDSLTALLAHIPYQIRQESEAYYHSIFLVWLKTLGFNIQGKISTDKGRIDAILKQDDFTIIAEIKYGIKKQLEEMLETALKQIKDKKYYAYLDKKIILLGIAFNGKEVKCKMRKL